jgi:hypothetical protein
MTDEPKHPNQPDFSSRFFELELRDLNDGKSATVRDPNAHYCTRCTKRIPEDDAIGPINIFIRDPQEPEGWEREFCTWECAADWFAGQAGRGPRYPKLK